MKCLVGFILGVVLTVAFLILCQHIVVSYIQPRETILWYASCLARVSNDIEEGKLKTNQTPFQVCKLFNDQLLDH